MAKKNEVETVRLRNINSGAVVSVRADKVDSLGSEWEAESARKTAATKKSSSSDDK